MSGDLFFGERAFLNVAVVVLQMCHQVSECELSPCSGYVGIFLEGDALCRKCDGLTRRSVRELSP